MDRYQKSLSSADPAPEKETAVTAGPGFEESDYDYNVLVDECDTLHPSTLGHTSLNISEIASAPQQVFAVGALDYSFTSRTREAIFNRRLKDWLDHEGSLLDFLKAQHDLFTWTLNLDQKPLYALIPEGPFAFEIYKDLAGKYQGIPPSDNSDSEAKETEDNRVKPEHVSLAGWAIGKTSLFDGRELPVVKPVSWGIEAWSTQSILDKTFPGNDQDKARADLESLLRRLYYELRNPGLEPGERAINFAATQAFVLGSDNFQHIFKETHDLGLDFYNIQANRSSFQRHDADSWDVDIIFFDPKNQNDTARRLYRFTIDVADVLPVTVNEDLKWYVPTETAP
ncbi:MAG: hypothetical protein QNK37_32835 [Acidobacteriota bacterium]|nr:hypothetical protein [Acidobacteriota bacterium]